jgi:hypothetical protein
MYHISSKKNLIPKKDLQIKKNGYGNNLEAHKNIKKSKYNKILSNKSINLFSHF